jgi:aryl-alcohol dehydrogenase-like predicted oxidoreductase
MQQRTLGTTGIPVTRMGVGLAALGRPGYVNLGHAEDLGGNYSVAAMEAHTHDVLDAAWAAGVRLFDAARSYGRSEVFLGNWLRHRKIAPEQVSISSKWGYTYTAQWQVQAPVHEVKSHTIEVLRRQWGETHSELGDFLRLYQVHSATLDSGILENTEVLNTLAEYKAKGVAIGLSLSGTDQAETLRRALEVQNDGVRLFDTVQATWNILEPSAGAALAEAHAAGMGVLVKEGVANGRLTSRNQEPDFAAKRAVLEQQAQRLGTSLDALALAAILAQPWADVVLSGAATVEHVQQNLSALDVAWDDEAADALAALAETPQEYWAKRRALPWN